MVRASNSEADLAQVSFKLASLQTELESNRQVLESAAADLAAAQQEHSLSQQEAAAAAANLAELERQQEDSRIGIMEVVAARLQE